MSYHICEFCNKNFASKQCLDIHTKNKVCLKNSVVNKNFLTETETLKVEIEKLKTENALLRSIIETREQICKQVACNLMQCEQCIW